MNLTACIHPRLRGTSCRILSLPLRVRVSARKFVYPDISIVCGSPQLTDEHQDTLTNPKLIIEILSPSTSDYDEGGKFRLYQLLPSFEEYLLVAQDEPRVDTYLRQPDHSWLLRTITGLDSSVELRTLGFSLPLAEIYEGISFPPPSEE